MCYIAHWILYIQLKEIEQGNMDETEKFITFHDIELSRVNYRILDGVAKIYGPYNIYAIWFKTNPMEMAISCLKRDQALAIFNSYQCKQI